MMTQDLNVYLSLGYSAVLRDLKSSTKQVPGQGRTRAEWVQQSTGVHFMVTAMTVSSAVC